MSLLLLSLACDQTNTDFMALPVDGFPGIVNLDPLQPIDGDTVSFTDGVISHALGPSEVGTFGGATTTFVGNGNTICLWVDPEAVFWDQAIKEEGFSSPHYWPENFRDDGDIDLEVGLSAYYTGSPGVEMGDFAQIYEDSLGNEIEVEFNECTMIGIRSQENAHAGRGSPEFCEINTALHPNRSYTVVLNTWSVPLDDHVVSYKVAAFDATAVAGEGANCGDMLNAFGGSDALECLFRNEADTDEFAAFEPWFCAGLQSFWCDCTSDPFDGSDACDQLATNNGVDFDFEAGTAKWKDTDYSLDYPDACGDL